MPTKGTRVVTLSYLKTALHLRSVIEATRAIRRYGVNPAAWQRRAGQADLFASFLRRPGGLTPAHADMRTSSRRVLTRSIAYLFLNHPLAGRAFALLPA